MPGCARAGCKDENEEILPQGCAVHGLCPWKGGASDFIWHNSRKGDVTWPRIHELMTTPYARLARAVEKTTMDLTVLSAAAQAKGCNPARFPKARNMRAFATERKRQFFEQAYTARHAPWGRWQAKNKRLAFAQSG